MALKSKLAAIIFTQRADVRNAVRDELRKIGLVTDQLYSPKDESEAIGSLNSLPEAILVLDWDSGVEPVLNILDQNRIKGKMDSHTVFLITSKIDDNIVATATEYHVAKIHSGEISSKHIKEALQSVYKDITNLSPIKKLLKQVGDHRRTRNFSGINEILAPMYEKMPNNTRIAVEYGENLLEMGEVDKAEEVLTQAANQEPPYARAKHILAKVFLKKGNPTRAVTCMQGAQLISPYNVKRLLELGSLFLDINQPQSAKNSFDEVLSLSPENKGGVLGKGTAMLAMGEVNEALALIKESANTKELASIFNTSAIISIKKGSHDDAINLYKTALNAVGKNKKVEARLWYNMGIGFIKWKKPSDGLDCFKKAVGLDKNFTDAEHNIGVIENFLSGGKVKKKRKLKKVSGEGVPLPRKNKKAGLTPAPEPKSEPEIEADEDLGCLEETLGAENLSEDFGSLDFDLDFDDDMDDDMGDD